LINPYTHEVTNYLNARKVFDLLVTCAWHTGDPGVIFIDSINEYNTVPDLGDIEATNPCGEQPLLPYEACNLGSLNLAKFIIPGTTDIDYTNLEKAVASAVHFLDNVITLNNYPTEDITEETHKTRKIGLGIMGWADMLMKMGIRYGTRKSILLAEEKMQFITDKGIEASSKLAEIRGTFPSYELSIFYDKDNDNNCIPMRNATVTTIAPTGTLSIIANCSSGIEPVFNFVYTKTILDNQTFHIVHPVFSELLEQHNIELTNERKQEVAEKGSVQDCDWLNDELKHILVTAFDISPKDHLDMQAAFQKHTHNAVSKTINLPEDATEDDIREIYLHSYYAGTKGVTVFRYGCKKGVLALKNKNKKDDKVEEHKTLRKPRKRPAITNGTTQRIATGCGNLYVTLNNDDIGFCEVFASMGKSGGCAASQLEACMRMASLALRVGIDPHVIVDQLSGIRCPTPTFGTGKMVYSCADGVSKIIGEMISVVDDNNPEDVETHKNHTHFIRPCPECGAGMESDGNCAVCRSCGYNLCG
jgi:ribonucleoside-diphosphate reductase alpha chain